MAKVVTMVNIGELRHMKVRLETAEKLDKIAKRRGIQGRGAWAYVGRELLEKAVEAEGAGQ